MAGARRYRAVRRPSSAQAPVDVVPVSNQGEQQQHERDQQQPGSLRRVDRVPAMLVLVMRSGFWHTHIVAPVNPWF